MTSGTKRVPWRDRAAFNLSFLLEQIQALMRLLNPRIGGC